MVLLHVCVHMHIHIDTHTHPRKVTSYDIGKKRLKDKEMFKLILRILNFRASITGS